MDLKISEMMEMQRLLQEKYKDKWGGLSPETGRNQLLWALIEAGEAADVIKKKGDQAIVSDPQARADFIEEIADTVMYLIDVLGCYSVTPEEFCSVYKKKADRNLNRW